MSLPDPGALARETPKSTALIEQRVREAEAKGGALEIRRSPVPLARISPHLREAVVLAEDARFFQHRGFDWRELEASAERNLRAGRFARGGSTISMQLAKNLYLGTEKSLWRKLKEALLTVKIERSLSKGRILELYLGVVELGDGVFGVEAGARHHFGVGADALTPAQAAILASMLPAPRSASLTRPSKRLVEKSRRVLAALATRGHLDAGARREAEAELALRFGKR